MTVKLDPKAKKRASSIFAPSRKGTNERSTLKRLRPAFLEVKDRPSIRRRLATNVYGARMALGMSQIELAKRARVGVATYQRIEQCQPSVNPGLDVLGRLAYALQLDFVELWSV